MIKQNILDTLKEDNPFKTPHHYFDGLTITVMSRLPEKQSYTKEADWRTSVYQYAKPWACLAAVFAGLILLAHLFVNVNKPQQLTNTPDDQDYLEFLEYEYYNDNFSYVMDNVE